MRVSPGSPSQMRAALLRRRPHVPIETVDADVELAADEPLRVRWLPIEDLVPRLDPLELTRHARPKCLRVFFGFLVDRLVLDPSVFAKSIGRRELAPFLKQGVDSSVLLGSSSTI